MYTVSLASRSLQGNNGVSDAVIRSSVSSIKPVQSLMKNQKLAILSDATNKKVGSNSIMGSSKSLTKPAQSSVKNRKPASVSDTTKKENDSQLRLRKKNDAKNGRYCFDLSIQLLHYNMESKFILTNYLFLFYFKETL